MSEPSQVTLDIMKKPTTMFTEIETWLKDRLMAVSFAHDSLAARLAEVERREGRPDEVMAAVKVAERYLADQEKIPPHCQDYDAQMLARYVLDSKPAPADPGAAGGDLNQFSCGCEGSDSQCPVHGMPAVKTAPSPGAWTAEVPTITLMRCSQCGVLNTDRGKGKYCDNGNPHQHLDKDYPHRWQPIPAPGATAATAGDVQPKCYYCAQCKVQFTNGCPICGRLSDTNPPAVPPDAGLEKAVDSIIGTIIHIAASMVRADICDECESQVKSWAVGLRANADRLSAALSAGRARPAAGRVYDPATCEAISNWLAIGDFARDESKVKTHGEYMAAITGIRSKLKSIAGQPLPPAGESDEMFATGFDAARPIPVSKEKIEAIADAMITATAADGQPVELTDNQIDFAMLRYDESANETERRVFVCGLVKQLARYTTQPPAAGLVYDWETCEALRYLFRTIANHEENTWWGDCFIRAAEICRTKSGTPLPPAASTPGKTEVGT